MEVVAEVLETCSKDLEKFKSINVGKKPVDVEYDLGYLLLTDENELDKKLLAYVLIIITYKAITLYVGII